jgi:hypothetical protein
LSNQQSASGKPTDAQVAMLGVRTSAKISDALAKEALSVFQSRTEKKLNENDAREMLGDLVNFFRILNEWDRAATQIPKDSDS